MVRDAARGCSRTRDTGPGRTRRRIAHEKCDLIVKCYVMPIAPLAPSRAFDSRRRAARLIASLCVSRRVASRRVGGELHDNRAQGPQARDRIARESTTRARAECRTGAGESRSVDSGGGERKGRDLALLGSTFSIELSLSQFRFLPPHSRSLDRASTTVSNSRRTGEDAKMNEICGTTRRRERGRGERRMRGKLAETNERRTW